MNQYDIVRIVSLVAFLVLAFSAYRAHNIGGKQTLVMILVWGCIFCLVALVAGFLAG